MVREILPFENMILTELAITHKDRAYSTSTGEIIDIFSQFKGVEGQVQSSERIPDSDQILVVS